jgi:valyl-tRNA synthetase
MDVQRAISNRQFGNKMWNAVKYALLHLPEQTDKVFRPKDASWQRTLVDQKSSLTLAEKWILSRLV